MLFEVMFLSAPIISAVLFVICLFRYLKAIRRNRNNPGSHSSADLSLRLLLLIISAVIFGVLTAVVLGFIALMYLAVSYM